jgi:hypothetical protein
MDWTAFKPLSEGRFEAKDFALDGTLWSSWDVSETMSAWHGPRVVLGRIGCVPLFPLNGRKKDLNQPFAA